MRPLENQLGGQSMSSSFTRAGSNQAEQHGRPTGSAAIPSVAWGSHYCLFYHTKEDLVEILVPYFKAGLEANEFCMWITSEPLQAEEARRALAQAMGDLDRYLETGRIEILDYRQWYTIDGRFDADRVLTGWVEKERQALKRGLAGLRLSGNTFWLETKDWQEFTAYEAAVDRVIGQHRMLALCTYSLQMCGIPEILDVVANHEFALIKRAGEWVTVESGERKHAAAERALAQRNKRLQTLHEIDQSIMASQSIAETAGAAMLSLLEATGALGAATIRFDSNAQQKDLLGYAGIRLHYPQLLQPAESYGLLQACCQGRVGTIDDVLAQPANDALRATMLAGGARCYTSLPLLIAGKPIGAVLLGFAEPGPLPQDTLDFALQVADQLSLAIRHSRLDDEVRNRRQQLQALSHRLVQVQESERRALSRDLHDTSGQSITALKLGLANLQRNPLCPPEMSVQIDELREIAETVSAELHRLAVNLRPSSLDRYGLVPALEQLLASFRKQNAAQVDFLATGLESQRLPDDVETALYRLVQEGLTNITRHARAQRVSVIVSRRDENIHLILEDDGCGFDVDQALHSGRVGLLGMRERAEMLGGTLTVESAPGCGTTLYVDVPFRQPSTW